MFIGVAHLLGLKRDFLLSVGANENYSIRGNAVYDSLRFFSIAWRLRLLILISLVEMEIH